MNTKYLVAGVVIGTVLLTSNNGNKSTMPLEKTVQTTQSIPTDNPTNPSPQPTPKDPNDYDPISNMKAILQPEDKIYDEKKQVVS